jgi:hypothetical protein
MAPDDIIMTNAEFTRFANNLVDEAFDTMGLANQEYASEGNKFDHFEGIAEFMRRFNPRLKDITAVDVAWVYRLKHMISEIKATSLREPMRGRNIDDLNYGLLIAGMMDLDLRRAAADEILAEGENFARSQPEGSIDEAGAAYYVDLDRMLRQDRPECPCGELHDDFADEPARGESPPSEVIEALAKSFLEAAEAARYHRMLRSMRRSILHS